MRGNRLICFMVVLCIGLTACAAPTASAPTETSTPLAWQEQYDLGVRYLSEGKYAEAILAFTAAIEIDPKQAPAYVGRGDAYILSGETDENLKAAQADYEQAIGLDTVNAEFYIKLAEVYILQGNLEMAKELLQAGAKTVDDSDLIDNFLTERLGMQIELDGFPKTVRSDTSDDGYTIQEYDKFGNLIRCERYNKSEEMMNEEHFYYDEAGKITMRSNHHYKNKTNEDSDDVYTEEYFDGQQRISSVSKIWKPRDGRSEWTEEHSYTYPDEFTVLAQIQIIQGEVICKGSKSYTLQEPGNYARVMGLSWSVDRGTLNINHLTEYSDPPPHSKRVKDVRYDRDGNEVMG